MVNEGNLRKGVLWTIIVRLVRINILMKEYSVECIVTENNYGEKNVEEYLKLQGFRLVEKLDFDDIYLHCNSKFSIV